MFPEVEADSLSGRHFRLPDELEGRLNLLVIGFWREQQRELDTWMAVGRTLAKDTPDLRSYEVPTIPKSGPLFRRWLRAAMRLGIRDTEARAETLTLYVDKPAFRKALDLPNEDTVYALLVDRSGRVLWRAAGPANGEKVRALEAAIASHPKEPLVPHAELEVEHERRPE